MAENITDSQEDQVVATIDPTDNDSAMPSPLLTILQSAPLPDLIGYSTDDEGNAQAVKALFGEYFRYCEALGWLYYTGTHWEREGAVPYLERAVVATLHQRRAQAALYGNNEHLTQIARSNVGPVQHAMTLLRSLVLARVEEFDISRDHLNVKNGVLDLRTGELTPHSPSQRYTYCLPVEYDAEADTSEWLQFLQQVVGGGEAVLTMLQQAVGYSLTGHTQEERLFYIFGPTRSGKGTFTEVLLKLLGKPLSAEVDFRTFTARRDNDANNYDLAPLRPTRLIVASESSKYDQLNTARVKLLTGGNYIRCCFKYGDHFEYRPQYKIWLVSNHNIKADPDDDAAWGRVIHLEFPHSFYGHEDKTLKERLKRPENLRGVLAWAVEGAKQWYASQHGVQVPAALRERLQAVQREQDIVQQWIDERTVADPQWWTPHETLHGDYKQWCQQNGYASKGGTEFGRALSKKGYAATKQTIHGTEVRGRTGLRLACTVGAGESIPVSGDPVGDDEIA